MLADVRYAVYLTPPAGSALASAGDTWLGRSALTGATTVPGAPAQARPGGPARYGFHATLKAPFRLRSGASEDDLLAAFRAHIAAHPPVDVPLHVARLSRFVALRSDDGAPARLAEAAVRAFEPLRAPLTGAERARRRPDALDQRGRELLDDWGYPHVFERFVFHMTLSGPMEADDTERVLAAARAHFGAVLGEPQRLVHAVFREAAEGEPFTVIAAQNELDG